MSSAEIWPEIFSAAKKRKNLPVITQFIGQMVRQRTILDSSFYGFESNLEEAAAGDIAIALMTEAAKGSGGLYDQVVVHIHDQSGDGLRIWLRDHPDQVTDFFTAILSRANTTNEEVPIYNFHSVRISSYCNSLSKFLHDIAA